MHCTSTCEIQQDAKLNDFHTVFVQTGSSRKILSLYQNIIFTDSNLKMRRPFFKSWISGLTWVKPFVDTRVEISTLVMIHSLTSIPGSLESYPYSNGIFTILHRQALVYPNCLACQKKKKKLDGSGKVTSKIRDLKTQAWLCKMTTLLKTDRIFFFWKILWPFWYFCSLFAENSRKLLGIP